MTAHEDPSTDRLITACPLDCPDTCTLSVTVADGRLVAVDAAPTGTGNPLTGGWICAKVRSHPRRVHGPERLLTPLVRSGPKGSGSFRPIGWEEALDRVASAISTALSDHGPASVVPFLYNSSAGVAADEGLTVRLFRELGTSEVAHTICAATAGAAWQATFPGMVSADPLDLTHSALVVVWGANPSASNTHLTPLLTAARKRGAPVVVIDPRRTPTAARADLHLAVRPGTDAVLGLALAAELDRVGGVDTEFCTRNVDGWEEYLAAADDRDLSEASELCGIDSADITRLAELIGTHRPAMLRMGWGLERNRNGAAGVRSALGLWALAGQFGVPGAGVMVSTSGEASVNLDWAGSPARVLNMNHIGRDLLQAEPSVEVLIVQGANPAVMAPDQPTVLRGLAREDLFCVVHEQVMTDTAVMADVVLPATTHFEVDDVAASYGAFTVERMPAVIDRVGESRSNDELAAGLAQRLGLTGYDPASVARDVLRSAGPTRPQGTVQFGPVGHPATTAPDGGRVRLALGAGADRFPVHRPLESSYPLTLLTPATAKTINSIFAEHDPPTVAVTMNPDDAAARHLQDGDTVRVFNDRTEIQLPVRIDEAIRAGVVMIPKGLWRRHVSGGLTANALVPDTVEHTVGGVCFNDARVEIASP